MSRGGPPAAAGGPRAGFRYGVSLAGAALCFVVFLVVLRAGEGPCGFDVYYYALQIRALDICGELLFSDPSLVHRVLRLVNLLTGDPILSVQILSSAGIALVCLCLLLYAFRRGFSFYAAAVASLAMFNPATFYQVLEFTKNNFAFGLFFLGWIVFSDREGGFSLRTGGPKSLARNLLGLAALAGSVLSHRMMALLLPCFLAPKFAGVLRDRLRALPGRGKALLLGGGAVLAGLLIAAAVRHGAILERLPPLDLAAPGHRLTQLYAGRLLAGERVFYLLVQTVFFLAIPPALILRRRFLRGDGLFAAAAWLMVFPFFRFSWDEAGFRFLILAPLMAAPWLMGIRAPAFTRPAAVVFAAAALFFTAESARHLAVRKGPDYRALREDFASIEPLVRGRSLVAHRGLAGFLWYEKGIRSENFLPSGDRPYLRLVYGFAPEIFAPWLEEGEAPPLRIGGTYTLMEESLWQRFYRDRRDLLFLRSELNPSLPRPASGFVINPRAAEALSPVSRESAE